MKYEKPSVVVLASANDVIQGSQGQFKTLNQIDGLTGAQDSVGAYEADE